MQFLRPAWLAVLLAPLSAQSIAPPEFVAGDLAQLEARVVEARSVDGALQILTVEVQNRGAMGAEPLEFRLELPTKKGEPPSVETFARVSLPRVQRFGRPVAPGGKLTFPVPTMLPGKKGQFAVRVLAASWYQGGRVGEPDLRVEGPTQVQKSSLAGTFPVSQVTLHNPFAHDLDVLCAVTFQQPKDTVELLGVRVPASGKVVWDIDQRPGVRPFLDPTSGPACPVKVSGLRVADWSLLAPCPSDLGADLLRPAYEAWYRWPEAALEVAGTFTYRERRQRVNAPKEYDEFRIRGRFTVARDGKLAVEVEDGKGANPGFALQEALQNLRRPEFAALAASCKLVPIAADRIAIEGPGWTWGRAGGSTSLAGGGGRIWNDLQIADGRIVGDGDGDGPRTSWETALVAGGYVVTRRHGTSIDTRFAYHQEGDRLVPSGVTSTTTFGDSLFSSYDLVLGDLQFTGVVPILVPPPQGAGAAALQAMWENGHRHPSDALSWTAQFEVGTPGTDLVWQGHKKLRGSLRAVGFGQYMRQAEFTFEGDLPAATQFALAAIVRDRFLMWHTRDFGDRPAFATFFRSATIAAPDAEGTFAITGGPVDAVLTGGGLVRGWRAGGSTTRFTWKAFGAVSAVVRIDETHAAAGARSQDRWSSAVVVTHAKIGAWLLPTAFTFERIFGRDWGPETLSLRELTVR